MSHDIIPALSVSGLQATPTGLIVHGDVPFLVWLEYGKGLARVKGALGWAIADWLNFGEAKYGETYSQALELFPDYSYQTLANLKSVGHRVPASERFGPPLDIGHHEVVARLDPLDRRQWLIRAEVSGWSVRELRDALRGTEEQEEERCPECGAAKRHWRSE